MSDREIVWMCGACGKTANSRDEFRETSCRTWAVRVYVDSIRNSGCGMSAEAVPERTEEEV